METNQQQVNATLSFAFVFFSYLYTTQELTPFRYCLYCSVIFCSLATLVYLNFNSSVIALKSIITRQFNKEDEPEDLLENKIRNSIKKVQQRSAMQDSMMEPSSNLNLKSQPLISRQSCL